MANPEDIQRIWLRALARWGLGVDLSPPVALDGGDALAYIDLRDRQTHINYRRLADLGLSNRLEAFMAHEAGHHCRHPQTLVRSAKLIARGRSLLEELECDRPGEVRIGEGFEARDYDFLANLFLDILINHSLRAEYGADYAAIYRRLLAERPAGSTATFAFALALYEALWDLHGPGAILRDVDRTVLKKAMPDPGATVAALATDLAAAEGNPFLGYDLFLEAIWPCLVRDVLTKQVAPEPATQDLRSLDLGDLEPDELEQVIRRGRAERAADSARQDRRRPVLVELPPDPDAPPESEGQAGDPLAAMLRAGRDFGGSPKRVSDLVFWFYERLAERMRLALDRIPAEDPLTPTTLADWEVGSDPAGIDWTASLGRAGVAVPGLTLLEREYEAEVVGSRPTAPPWIEIYMDSSGSMPDPARAFSSIAFAGFLLARAALKAGAKVRLIQYSGRGNALAMDDFSADEAEVLHTLLEHLGGGTSFPFDLLAESLARFRSAATIERLVLTDFDFFHNTRNADDRQRIHALLAEAAQAPNRFTAVINTLGLSQADYEKNIPDGLVATGIRLLPIAQWNQLHGLAEQIGRTIYGP